MSIRRARNRQRDDERAMRSLYGSLTKEALQDTYKLNVEGNSIVELERNYEKEINKKKMYDEKALDDLYEAMRNKARLYNVKGFKDNLKTKEDKAKELIEFNPFTFYEDQSKPKVIMTRKLNKDYLDKMKEKDREMYGFSEGLLFSKFNEKDYLRDTDNDGIPDIEEIGRGMNPFSTNSSGDRFNDREAIALGVFARHIQAEDQNRDGSILDDLNKTIDKSVDLER